MNELRRRVDRLEQALEYIARGFPMPAGEETPQQLVGLIFDMQNFASAALAGVKPITLQEMADLLATAGVMSTSARNELQRIFTTDPGRKKER